MASENPHVAKTAEADFSNIDVPAPAPAPAGWKKKITPKKGVTPERNEIVFVAPDGEEIKRKTQLRGYLKSHSGGVTFKEFDWSAGDTLPRRSSRLSGKSNALESPDNDTSRKRQRKSSGKKEKEEESEDEATNEGNKEASNADVKDVVEHDEWKDAVFETNDGEDTDTVAEEEKAVMEEHEAVPEEQKNDAMEQDQDAAAEEEKSDVKEHEAAVDDDAQKSDVKEQEAAIDG